MKGGKEIRRNLSEQAAISNAGQNGRRLYQDVDEKKGTKVIPHQEEATMDSYKPLDL